MNDSNPIFNRIRSWLDGLSADDRSDVQRLWDEAADADPARQLSVSKEEKKRALHDIKAELGLQQPPAPGKPGTARNLRWMAAAAVLLLAAGLSWLLVPVRVAAPAGEQLSYRLPDRSQVTLNSGTVLYYNRLFSYTNRAVRIDGEAFFEVESAPEPFTVSTGEAVVEVLGTRFNLRSWDSDPAAERETVVTLTEGALRFYGSGEPERSVRLNPGEQSVLKPGSTAPERPFRVTAGNALAWMENRFAFEERTVGSIIRELERRFDTSIEVRARAILDDRLTVYYSREVSAEQILQDICLSKGVNYRAVNNGYIVE